MARRKPRTADPFEVELTDQARLELTQFLCDAIQEAKATRATSETDHEYWHRLYRQDLTRLGKNAPWADAADLTSYIATEKVDSMRARIMRTVFSEPIWTVEGYGQKSAQHAPIVEAFHQWQSEAEGLQTYLYRVIHSSLIETRGILEVYEDTTERRTRKQMKVAVQMDPFTAQPILGENGEPQLVRGPDDRFVEATDLEPHAEVIVDTTERVRRGPAYRIIPYRDFLVLPEHASDKSDVWGFAKRFTKRLGELRHRAALGAYDKAAVEALGTQPDMQPQTDLAGASAPQAPQHDEPTVEKELWEVLLLRDLDGQGERWYLATVSEQQRQLLRVQHDDIGAPRYMIFRPFPRPDRAYEGYSFVGHKLITAIEEHTAWRNMLADRAALVVQAPIKRQEGALWDPTAVPWGPKAIIDVRDMNEIQPIQIPDMNAAAIDREREILQASERVAGINDVAMGVNAQEQRTLGEVSLVAEQSFVRMDESVKNLDETLEELGALRHVIWRRALAENSDMLEVPDGVLVGLEMRGIPIESGAERQMLLEAMQGTYRFKPRGSVETADIKSQRNDYMQFLQVLPQLVQGWPELQALLHNPQAPRAMMEQALRLFRFPDRQAILGSEAQAAMQQAMMPPPGAPPGPPGMGGPPGMPPGMGGPPGPPGMPPGPPGMPPGPPGPPPGPPGMGGPPGPPPGPPGPPMGPPPGPPGPPFPMPPRR